MNKIHLLCCLLVASITQAQLVNNGATITIQSGASIFCAGNFTNTSGTITNDGKIEVQGSFVNSGTYNSTTSDDSLILSGAGNATLNSGGATLRYLTINKASNADLVTLGGTVIVANKLDYLAGILSTDYLANPSYFLSAPGTAVFNFAAGREIAGNVKRTGWANGSTFLFNGANMQLATNGGTAPTDFMVTMLPDGFGGDPSQTEREVKRKFLFTPTGGSGFTTDIRFPYAAAELNTNTEGNLVPWNLVSAEWNARFSPVSRDGVNDWVSTTGIDVTALAQEWKLADPRYTFNVTAHLRGAWNSVSQDMNASITSSIQLTQPYSGAPWNYAGTENVGAIPNANVVDWVLLDFRKPADGLPGSANSSTVIGQKAAFLLKNGSIVELDGATPVSFNLSKQGNGFFVFKHRNHLAVMSNSLPSNAAGTFTNDFSALANSYANIAISNIPQQGLPGSVKYGLWAGDANRDGVVNASDIGLIKAQANASLVGYQYGDVNLDATVNASDVGLAKLSANASASSHSLRGITPTTKKTHVPVD